VFAAVFNGERPDGGVVRHLVAEKFRRIVEPCVLTTSALVLKASRVGLSPSPKLGPTFDPEILRISTKSSAAAWRRFKAKVRSSFCNLKSYLSSGKSCAMATSLFPMPFH
jgi:hypothetical protein